MPTPLRAARIRWERRLRCSRESWRSVTTSTTARRRCSRPATARVKVPGTKCRMDGFDLERSLGGPRDPQYAYVPHDESKPYFDMAHEWVLADRMFQSQIDESFVAHQYIIAGQAQSSVDVPFLPEWGCNGGRRNFVETILPGRSFGSPQRACFDYTTLGDELDEADLTWRFYTSRIADPADGVWSGYQAIAHIRYGPDWKKDVVTPQKRFLTDVAAGTLANVTWITPTCEESDHVNCGGGLGPSWVTSIVNAVGRLEVLEFDGDFRVMGRLGRPLRSRCAAASSTTTVWDSAFPCSSSRRTRNRTSCRTCDTNTAASCGSPKTCSAWGAWRPATRARTRRPTTVSILRSRRASSFRFERRGIARFSSIVATICARPTTNSPRW